MRGENGHEKGGGESLAALRRFSCFFVTLCGNQLPVCVVDSRPQRRKTAHLGDMRVPGSLTLVEGGSNLS